MKSGLVPDAVFNGPTINEAPCGKNKVMRIVIIWKSPDETVEQVEERWNRTFDILFNATVKKMVAEGKGHLIKSLLP